MQVVDFQARKKGIRKVPFSLNGGERGIYFRHLHVFYNLLRINTLYHLFYVVPIIYSNNYIVLSTAKIDIFFYFAKHFSK